MATPTTKKRIDVLTRFDRHQSASGDATDLGLIQRVYANAIAFGGKSAQFMRGLSQVVGVWGVGYCIFLSQKGWALLSEQDVKELRGHLEPSDSAGAYWAWSAANRSADPVAAFVRVSAGTTTHYSHASFGNVAATVNVGHPSTHYASINGIQARFQAHTAAAMVLMDREQFPDAQAQIKELPEGWVRRLP